ncbi:MAG: hypothetical protein SO114_06120 [Candidatus Cryptobacteroides sp.]|nr:hypothetical protein [Candidatus Cryptobacteroides sp.]
MKKTIFFAAALLLAVGCQKSELIEKVQEQNMITHTFSVDEEDTKSLFDPNSSSIKLDKKESIAVGWAPVGANGAKINGIVEAKRSDDGKLFSFSHDEVTSASAYNYFFVMPYRDKSNIRINGDGNAMSVKIDGVQHPTATSFDPLQDYILGEPVLNATEKQTSLSSKNLRLKRLFSPLRVTLRDEKNVFGGEPLMSVSIGFPLTTEADKKNNLATLVYLKSTETDENGNTVVADFANAGPSGYAKVDTDHVSPTVTAEYADGLAMDNGTYTVWYVTLPVEKAAGTELTVVAQSKNKKVTRKIALPKAMKLKAGIINDLKINITGEGYKEEDSADPNDYWSIYNAGQDIVAGGMTINKSSHENATLLSGDQITNDDLQKGGLIFVEGNFSSTKHLKLAKGSIIIGRYKDSQPSITMNSDHTIYLDKGDLVLKNLNIGGSTTADRLFVISGDDGNKTSDYAVIEDCTITANKKVCAYAYQGKDKNPNYGHAYYVIKSLTFDNCIIKMAGTSQNNMVIMLPKHVKGSYDAYKDITKLEISNCVIYADAPFTSTTSSKNRRQLMDLGNSGAGYQLPLEKATIIAKNNTLYNINANGNQLIRAYSAYATDISGNVMYNDYASTPDGTFTATTVLQLNAANPSQGGYKVQSNYSYGYFTSEQTTNKVKWTNGSAVTYTTGSNNQDLGQEQDRPFTTADMTKGYFPVNSANIQKATGASYETKPWVKVK